jgi:phytoene synthase
MTPDDYCQQKTAQSGSSFYYSFLFLPPPRRRAITAFYAFCREVDDVVDECTDLDVARTKLAWWRTEVAALYEGKAKHPVALALAALLPEFNIEQARLHEIIDGMEMDLTRHRYADFSALQKYCYRVASVVGLVSAEIFGHSHPDTLKYAENLGMAFQLTNIIRDVGEDARRDRIYIPVDELARFNVTAADIMHARHSEAFVQLMQFQVERALNYYRDAMSFLPQQDRRAQRPGLVMAAIYRTLLEEIRADGMQVLNQRTSLTPLRKLWIAWRTWIKG